ncbi:MAG: SPFH domain-containing protein [Firmicutes bacterium]|nr:SPFH domain-containing protein [Candidatus Colivicinus equi]
MGLIKAGIGAFAGTLADTWKDYFVCDSLNNDTLITKGVKKGSSSLFADPDVITNGSGIVVADGQCALIVDEGQILEVANEPGNYTFDTTKSPSIFDGGFKGIADTFKEMIGRFTYGGIAAKNQRVYYVNTKEILNNLYGTTTPIPFRVIDRNINLDVDISVRCNGEYSFKIVNPLLFYKNVAGNVSSAITKEDLAQQMKSELLTALQPVFAKISATGVRYSEIPAHTTEMVDELNNQLSTKWADLRGINVVSFGVNSISASKEDEDMIKELQKAAVNKDPNMAGATLVTAQADAMRDAANNANGAGMGFMGMNMAMNAGANAQGFYGMQSQQTQTQAPTGEVRYCKYCGKQITADSRFCPYCGKEQ